MPNISRTLPRTCDMRQTHNFANFAIGVLKDDFQEAEEWLGKSAIASTLQRLANASAPPTLIEGLWKGSDRTPPLGCDVQHRQLRMKNNGEDYLGCRNVEIIVAMRLYWYFATRSRFATINSQLQVKIQVWSSRKSFQTSFDIVSEYIIYIQVENKFALMNEDFPTDFLNLDTTKPTTKNNPSSFKH